MTIYDLYIYECVMYLFKKKEKFTECRTSLLYSTQHSKFVFPIHRLTLFEKHPNYMAIKLYNHLPNSMKSFEWLNTFKKKIENLSEIKPYCLWLKKILKLIPIVSLIFCLYNYCLFDTISFLCLTLFYVVKHFPENKNYYYCYYLCH